MFNGQIHYYWSFSIATCMLNYQRVYIYIYMCVKYRQSSRSLLPTSKSQGRGPSHGWFAVQTVATQDHYSKAIETLTKGKCCSGSGAEVSSWEILSNTWMITAIVSTFPVFCSEQMIVIRSLSIPNSSQSQVCTSQLFNRSLLVDGQRFSAIVYTVYLYVYAQG